jgi:ribonuclease HI
MVAENALNIFTDGSSFRSPRRGGIGVRFVLIGEDGQEVVQDVQFTGFANATNNQMELQACIAALEEAIRLHMIEGVRKVIVTTDSLYVSDNIGKAMFQWPNTKWHNASGRPILNADLWKRLVATIRKTGRRVEFKWVKGHAKNTHNKAADKLARQSARVAFGKPLSLVHVRRKLSPRSVELGSVRMEGQRLTIRIITTEHLAVQRTWKCKYEVVSKSSKYKGCVDIVFSKELLAAGHTYYVQVNTDTRNPRVTKIFREIPKKVAAPGRSRKMAAQQLDGADPASPG